MKRMRRLVPGVLAVIAVMIAPAAASAAPVDLFLSTTTTPAYMTAASYPATVSGSRTAVGEFLGPLKLLETGEGKKVRCGTVKASVSSLTAATKSISSSPTYSGCTFGDIKLGESEIPVTVSMHGCQNRYSTFYHYVEEAYVGDSEIVCGAGSEIDLELSGGCTIGIPAQDLTEVEMFNTTIEGKSAVYSADVGDNLEYTVKNKAKCAILGLTYGTYNDGSSLSLVTFKGFNLTGGKVLAGEPAPGVARLAAAAYPANVTMKPDKKGQVVLLRGGAAELICSSGSNGLTLNNAVTGIEASVNYSGCTIGATPVTVTASGCRTNLGTLETADGELYTTPAELACYSWVEEQSIKITGGGCTILLPEQGLSGAEFTNTVVEGYENVLGNVTGTGLTYIVKNNACVLLGFVKGTHSDGELDIDVQMSATT
jgi:hypothetical protein